jgi:hypothetical protein
VSTAGGGSTGGTTLPTHSETLTFRQFSAALMPSSRHFANLIIERAAAARGGGGGGAGAVGGGAGRMARMMDAATTREFASCLALLCAIEFVADLLRGALARRSSPPFDFGLSFGLMDTHDTGEASPLDFRRFFKAYGMHPTDNEAHSSSSYTHFQTHSRAGRFRVNALTPLRRPVYVCSCFICSPASIWVRRVTFHTVNGCTNCCKPRKRRPVDRPRSGSVSVSAQRFVPPLLSSLSTAYKIDRYSVLIDGIHAAVWFVVRRLFFSRYRSKSNPNQ